MGWILLGIGVCCVAVALALSLVRPGSDYDDDMDRIWGQGNK